LLRKATKKKIKNHKNTIPTIKYFNRTFATTNLKKRNLFVFHSENNFSPYSYTNNIDYTSFI
jgi:hypothetical protein